MHWLLIGTIVLSSWTLAGAQESGKLSAQEFPETQKQAEAGDAIAQFKLGQAYDFGEGVAQNEKSACLWYRKAADQGYASAQNALGVMYRTGRGVEQSKQEAVSWYRKAAKQSNAKAMFNLGTAYYNGDGVAIDDVAAYSWFLLAQEHGSEPARDAVNRTRDTLAPWQLSLASETIGDFYEQGKDLPQDHKVALDWYRKAAQLGEATVRVKLAKFLIDSGDAQNYPEALHMCEEAAATYSPGALCAGLLHQRGIGTPPSVSDAVKWFNKSAEMGNAQAMFQLGEMYWNGTGLNQDRVSAYAFMILASTADLPDALRNKTAYEQSLSPKDLEKARKQAQTWARKHPVQRVMELPRHK